MPYSIFIFVYNILLTTLYVVAATVFAASFIRRQRMADGWIAALFTAYIIDEAIINMTETIDEFSQHYDEFSLSSNIAKTIILAFYFLCFGHIFKLILNTRFTKIDKAIYFVYIAALVTIPLIPTSRFTFWLYYTVTQLILAYITVRFYRTYYSAPDALNGRYGSFIKMLVYLAGGFVAAIVIEDTVVIFLFDNISLDNIQISQRNFSEDIMRVYLIAIAFFYYFNRKAEPEEPARGQDILMPATSTDKPDKLAGFIKDYKITPRETEILKLLLQGHSNQQISDDLFISLGTVKNHIHNIFQKCDVTKRSQLLDMINKNVSEK